MARFGAYYALCPLIDTNSLLGILEDAENDIVIVTLGKNISYRYKLSDQKQITCWKTKEKFSSPVIYDVTFHKYVAVFNQSYIKMWDLEENLDMSKKYKFNMQIHSLISNRNITLVVFKNGAVYELSNVIRQRKKLIPEKVIDNNIKNVIYKDLGETFYVGLRVEGDNHFYCIIYDSKDVKFTKIDLSHIGQCLKGFCFHAEKDKMVLLTLWSDGMLFSHLLEESNSGNTYERFAIIDFLSTDYDISMHSLDENYIALYGADRNQEGAALIIYSTQFKVAQTRKFFKLFTETAKLWLTENLLLLPIGQTLVVVPFKLEVEQLTALIGSHKIIQQDVKADVNIIHALDVASWVESHKIRDREVPDLLKNKISDLVYQGMPESMILEEMLPDIIKDQDTKVLSHSLSYFSDLSEKYLAKILKFLLETETLHFKGNRCDIAGISEKLQPLERVNLLDNILKKTFNETLLLPHLRSTLSLNNVLLLLDYIYLIGSDDGYVLPGLSFVETESRLIEWCSILIDSNYQKIVLSNDENMNEILQKFSKLIESHLLCLKDLMEIAPLLEQIKRQKIVNRESKFMNFTYTIEQFTLYS